MGFFGDRDLEKTVKIQAQTIEEQFRYIIKLERRLYRCLHSHTTLPHGVKLIYINNSNQKIMDIALDFPGPSKTGTPQLIDIVTGQPVSGATFTNGVANVANPTIATVSVDPNTGIATATPLAAGVTTVTITTVTDFTDSNGQPQTGTTQTTDPMTLTVTAIPTANGVRLEYTWS